MKRLANSIRNLMFRIRWYAKTPFEYGPPPVRTDEERREMARALELEIDGFIKQVGKRLPSQWDIDEMAWYESIRCREATL